MKRYITLIFLLPFCLFADEILVEQKPVISSALRLFDDWVDSQIASRQIPGAVVGIIHKDRLIWAKSYGISSLSPERKMTLNTLFPVCSLTKPITACALLKLWQQGKVDLQAPIDKYLPGFAIKGYNQKNPITVKQLLNHTSGLPQDGDFPYWNDLEFPTFHALWLKMKEQSLVFPSGTTWKYSNLGYALLGKIVEVASWQDYSAYIQKEIFTPLKMKKATFLPLKEEPHERSLGFSRLMKAKERHLLPFYALKGLASSLGLFATLDDMVQFSLMFLNASVGKAVLETPTRRLMAKPSIIIHPQLAYGLGLSIRRTQGTTFLEHPGNLPGFSAYLSLDPKQQCGIIIFCNSQEWLLPWVNEANRWVFSALRHPVDVDDADRPLPPVWKKYVGKYSNREGEVYVEINDRALVLYQPLFANKLDQLIAQTDGTFRIVEGYTFNSSKGDNVSFQLSNEGDVEWMKIANMYLYPDKT